ncbi:hypothetical protein [Flavobacterium sp. H122]|nr:hypothetical protein [Flavobacterium sp. H122]
MKESILKMKSVQVLTKEEQKHVCGAGLCTPGSPWYASLSAMGLCQAQ